MKHFKELTGKWRLQKRFFGGYNVLVEEIEHVYKTPVHRWRKAQFIDIMNLTILEKFKTDAGI